MPCGTAWLGRASEMSPWIVRMAQVTHHLGFGLTYASTFMHPFYTARLLNSLDHITNGRIAFNVITSQRRADYANYGYDELMDHDERYDRLEEFIDVCRALWTSVDPDAFVWDRRCGIVADPRKVRAINHAGKFFKVSGPSERGPLASDSTRDHPGRRLAARNARGGACGRPCVRAYQIDPLDAPAARRSRQGSDRERARPGNGRHSMVEPRDRGRDSRRSARDARELIADVPPEAVGVWLSHNTGYDMSQLPERFSLAELQQRIVAANASPVGFVHLLAKEHGEHSEMTREEFFRHGLRAATGYNITFAGTAAQLADSMEEMFEATGNRGGFMLRHSQAERSKCCTYRRSTGA